MLVLFYTNLLTRVLLSLSLSLYFLRSLFHPLNNAMVVQDYYLKGVAHQEQTGRQTGRRVVERLVDCLG